MSFYNFRVFRVKEYCGCFMLKIPRVKHESRGISVEQIDHYGGSYGLFPPTIMEPRVLSGRLRHVQCSG